MFIPHSEKKVFNFRINAFILFVVLLISFSTIAVIASLSINLINKHSLYKQVYDKITFSEKRTNEYREMLNEIFENHNIFKSKLDILLSHINSDALKGINESQKQRLNQGGPFNQVDASEINDFDMEKMTANDLINDYQYSIQAFGEINKMANNYNKLMKDLPFGCPVKGSYIFTSGFGLRIHPIHKVLDMHQGIDLANQAGTQIVATAPGIVEKIEWNPAGYGWYLKISHKLGFSTLYAHMRSKPVVNPGDKVREGQLLGYMGRSGATTGVHLHYEIRLGDNLLDPWKFVMAY